MKTCIVIYNPNSGHTLKKEDIPSYKSIIEKHGYHVTFIGTEYKGHAKEIVSHLKHVDLVISMGGDGTFNEIVYGNLCRTNRITLAHIPVGTTNDVGVMFGYGKDIKKNLELCLSGQVVYMDIPLINNRPFVYVAGFAPFTPPFRLYVIVYGIASNLAYNILFPVDPDGIYSLSFVNVSSVYQPWNV